LIDLFFSHTHNNFTAPVASPRDRRGSFDGSDARVTASTLQPAMLSTSNAELKKMQAAYLKIKSQQGAVENQYGPQSKNLLPSRFK
jgi:hypothetical protein